MPAVFSKETPWGQADHVESLGKGVMLVCTPSHGGIFVPDELLHMIPANQQAWAKKWTRSANWYEEDCCWACVAVAFPELFPDVPDQYAQGIVNAYCNE